MNSCHFDFNGHRVPVWTLTYRVMRLRTEPIERPIEAVHPEHSPSWSVVLLLARGRPQPAGSHRKPSWRRRGRCLGRPAPPTGGRTRYTRVAVGKEEKSLEIIGGMKIIYRVTVLLPSLHSSCHTVQLLECLCRKFEVNNVCGISVSANWKLQVSAVWPSLINIYVFQFLSTHKLYTTNVFVLRMHGLVLRNDLSENQRTCRQTTSGWATAWQHRKRDKKERTFDLRGYFRHF